jgi:hypothetical protein
MKRTTVFALLPDIHLGRGKLVINPIDALFARKATGAVGQELEKRLATMVKKINQIDEIQFTISTGDLTESATNYQLTGVKTILGKLEKPWLPVPGNHDIRLEDRYSPGDRFQAGLVQRPAANPFRIHFEEEFDRFSDIVSEWNEQEGSFHNLSFVHNKTRFVIVDVVSRKKAPFGFPGTSSLISFNQPGKRWLREQLCLDESVKVVVSHFPLNIRRLKKWHRGDHVLGIGSHFHREAYRLRHGATGMVTGSLHLKPRIPVIKVAEEHIDIHLIDF